VNVGVLCALLRTALLRLRGVEHTRKRTAGAGSTATVGIDDGFFCAVVGVFHGSTILLLTDVPSGERERMSINNNINNINNDNNNNINNLNNVNNNNHSNNINNNNDNDINNTNYVNNTNINNINNDYIHNINNINNVNNNNINK